MKEVSYYALDIENLEDLVREEKVKMTHEVGTLRVMHCNSLISLKGLHLFQNLTHLNLSSNSLQSMTFLDSMT